MASIVDETERVQCRTPAGDVPGQAVSRRMNWVPSFSTSLRIVATLLAMHSAPVQAQLMGHGGPVRAIAISSDGNRVLSGSFDTAAIRWSLKTESAEQVLRFHSDAVNAVAFLKDGRMVTAGADARIAIWTRRPAAAGSRFSRGIGAPIVALAVSPDGATTSIGLLGPYGPALVARRRRAARAGRACAERQRRRIHAGRTIAGQRGLRP